MKGGEREWGGGEGEEEEVGVEGKRRERGCLYLFLTIVTVVVLQPVGGCCLHDKSQQLVSNIETRPSQLCSDTNSDR